MAVPSLAHNDDCLARLGGAGVLTGTATDAAFPADLRQPEVVAIGHRIDCFGRTMLGARRAIRSLRLYDAVFQIEVGHADPCRLFFQQREQGNRGIWAGFRATPTIVIAKGRGKIEPRLQEAGEPILQKRGLQDLRRAGADAKVAARAAIEELINANGAGRTDRRAFIPPERGGGDRTIRVSNLGSD